MNSDTLNAARRAINQAYLANEASAVRHLLVQLSDYPAGTVSRYAQELLEKIRRKPRRNILHHTRQSITQAFLTEYQLNSDEGIALMTIAEALLNYGDSLLNALIIPYCQHGSLTSYSNSRLSTSCDTTW